MQVVMVYSESGGVSKTTTAVSLAMCSALVGKKVVLIDLDPRAATTNWLGAEPAGDGLSVGAILADENPEGWANDIAVQSTWSPNLRVIPSERSVSNREAESVAYAELRLKVSLEGLDADLVVLDCPNRQGGPLTLAALNAADTVVYAATASGDGVNGVTGARRSIEAFRKHRAALGAKTDLHEAGIVVGAVRENIMSRPAIASIDEMRDTGLLLVPLIPDRAIIPEVRLSGEWYGNYQKGRVVLDAYNQIMKEIIR